MFGLRWLGMGDIVRGWGRSSPKVTPYRHTVGLGPWGTCPECARTLTREDCFCDGIVCTQCGSVVRGRQCDGRCSTACDSIGRTLRERGEQLSWLISERERAIACWRSPCGGVLCAEFGPGRSIVDCAIRQAALDVDSGGDLGVKSPQDDRKSV